MICMNMALAAEDQKGMWLGTFANKKLTENYSFWIETQLRYNLDEGNAAQVLYRTGVLQKLNERQGLGYLYAFIQSGLNKEHRFTLQHTQSYGNLSNYKFSHRVRVETRHLEETTESFEAAGRLRYLLRAEQRDDKNYALVVWDEVFINLNETSWNGHDTQDRNRFFIGVKQEFFASNRLELGYLNQFIPRESGDISEHIATVYLFF